MAARGGGLTAVEAPDLQGWRSGPGRRPRFFTHCEVTEAPGPGHGLSKGATLCGSPEDRVTVYRSPFDPTRETACHGCRTRAVGDPEPGVRERLQHRVRGAVPSRLREELLAALRQGAEVGLWVGGPAADLVRRYAQRERIVEGGEPVEALIRADRRLGLARVVHGTREFVVFIPEDGRPFVTRAAPRT